MPAFPFQIVLSSTLLSSRASSLQSIPSVNSQRTHITFRPGWNNHHHRVDRTPSYLNNASKIQFQQGADFGRGDAHLSAVLEEGDVVAYATGTWEVDGVIVGDGTPRKIKLARVDHTQIVWTHNCEHGYIRGDPVELSDKGKLTLSINEDNTEMVAFGPEQLIARIPVEWTLNSSATLSKELFDELEQIIASC